MVEPHFDLWISSEPYHVALDLEQPEIGVQIAICDQWSVQNHAHVIKWNVEYLIQSQKDVFCIQMNLRVFLICLYLSERNLGKELLELILVPINQMVQVWLSFCFVQHNCVVLQKRRRLRTRCRTVIFSPVSYPLLHFFPSYVLIMFTLAIVKWATYLLLFTITIRF